MTPERPPHPDLLVLGSRRRILDSLLRHAPGERAVHEIIGAWGTGKTWLVRELRNRLPSAGHARVISLEIEPAHDHPAGGSNHHEEFWRCLRIARAIARQLDGSARRRLERALGARRWNSRHPPKVDIRVTSLIKARGQATVHAPDAQHASFDMDAVWAHHWAAQEDLLLDEVIGVLAPLAASEARKQVPLALLVDDFHLTRRRTAAWLREIISTLPAGLVVVTRQEAGPPDPLPATHRHVLDLFTESELRQFLTHRLGHPPSARLLALVSETTGRLPWAVTLVADAIAANPPRAERDLARLLAEPDLTRRLHNLLERLFLDHQDLAFRHCLERLAVLRGFDHSLAGQMLADDLPPGVSQGRVLADLRRAGLIEAEPAKDGQHLAWPPARARVPDLVRTAIVRELANRDPDRFTRLHRRAADCYWDRITEPPRGYDPDSLLAYWYRFESQRWQQDFTEWLHHLARVPDVDREACRMLLTRWYLEGLFWYDMYVPHWFCPRLLDSCAEFSRTDHERTWLGWLRTVHLNFGRGWRHIAPPEAWRAVIDALLEIRADLNLKGRTPPAAPTDRSQAYAIANHLLGDSLRFSGGDPERASRYYDEARTWYVGEENAWCRAYADIDQADLWLRAGDPNPAAQRLAGVEELAREEGDVELTAYAWRVHADLCWHTRAPEAAMAAYLKAVLHALSYQVEQEDLPEQNDFPDAYTRQLYEEMTARTAERIAELRHERPDLADRAERVAALLFQPFWDHAGLEPTGVFPPAPADEDLGKESSDYVRHARAVVDQHETILALRISDRPSLLDSETWERQAR